MIDFRPCLKRLLFVLVVAATSAASLAWHPVAAAEPGTPAAAAPPAAAPEYCPDSQELAFLELINEFRADNDRPPLALSRTLGAAAEHHSQDMARENYFSHTLSDGTTWSDNILARGYPEDTALGENLAAGHQSAKAVFRQWLESDSHRKNMLDPAFVAIGIGRATDADSAYQWYWTTTFGGALDDAPVC